MILSSFIYSPAITSIWAWLSRVNENERTMPRFAEVYLAAPGAYQVLHFCSYAFRVLRAVTGSRAPTPDAFASLHIPVAGLTQDASNHGSSAKAITPCNGFSPAPFLTIATRAVGIPCCRVTPPGINGVLMLLTPEDGRIG